jgi:hypothetical protein
MSVWGSEIDGIIAVVRGAVTTMPKGVLGAEFAVRDPSTLQIAELPHLFVYSPSVEDTPLPFLQAEVRTTYQADLWSSDSQEQLATWWDVVRVAMAANRTLTGAVVDCRLRQGAVLDDGDPNHLRVLVMIFETLRWEG